MCTVTLIPLSDGYRLVSSRDENRSRPAALPPRVVTLPGGNAAAYPTDPQGGGTWAAVNAAGLAMAILNLNDGRPAVAGTTSRGLLIPALLAATTVDVAVALLDRHDPMAFSPFRLLIADRFGTAVVVHAGDGLDVVVRPRSAGPLVLASSGLGDSLVVGPRTSFFRELVEDGFAESTDAERVRRQDAFHDHRWADAPHLSVRMSRADARTVSRTAIAVRGGRVTVRYAPVSEDDAPPVESEAQILEVPCAR